VGLVDLENHFPESLHSDILSAVGLELGVGGSKERKRDRQFRQRVLTAYEYRCAVCGFDVRLGSVSIALDAAHIRWHQAGGPDRESNGLALCVLHHKIFDPGAFTLDHAGGLLVSDQAHGTTEEVSRWSVRWLQADRAFFHFLVAFFSVSTTSGTSVSFRDR
jgi:putative restriction endonuclease